jgi:hypothetical protein
MKAGLINLVERMPEALRHELFLHANQRLLQHIDRDIKSGATVFVANASERQYKHLNMQHQLMFDTGCLFDDLQALTMRLRKGVKCTAVNLDALTMYDIVHNLPDGENYKNAVGFIKQIYHQSDYEDTALNNIFLHAHYHASMHRHAPLDLHCYVNSETAFNALNEAIITHHARMPEQANIIVHHYNGAILATKASLGSGIKRDNFRAEAALLEKPLHLQVRAPSDKFSAHMLDADNCVFNIFYFYFLTFLVEKYGHKIAACRGLDLKTEEMAAFGKEMLEFVQTYPSEELFAQRGLICLRDPLVKKFSDIPLDQDILDIRDGMLADWSGVFDKNQHGPIFTQLVRYIDGISPEIMMTIIYRTNDLLFNKIVEFAKSDNANRIVLLIGSLRQSYKLDMMSTVWNGTSRFHTTLKNLVTFLNQKYADQGVNFLFDTVTTTDYSQGRLAGSHIATAGSPDQQAIELESDKEKIRIAYALSQYARGTYSVHDLYFYDDTVAIFQFIEKSFGRRDPYGLMPAGMRLIMHGYNGDFLGKLYYIDGTGPLDQYPFDVVRYTTRTNEGRLAVLDGNLEPLLFARQLYVSSEIKKFVELTRWQHPPIFFAPSRQKTSNKIMRSIDVFLGEVNRFTVCSPHVKNGMYAGRAVPPCREISALMTDIKVDKISLKDGLEKIILLAKDHQPIRSSAIKLLNLVRDGGQSELSQTWFPKAI